MKFDIVIVTYNSKKWMENCINSIEKQEKFELKDINLYIVDNGSKDGTLEYIIDESMHQIKAELIDSISETINNIYYQLLEMDN